MFNPTTSWQSDAEYQAFLSHPKILTIVTQREGRF